MLDEAGADQHDRGQQRRSFDRGLGGGMDVGQRFGGYRIDALLGRGGMGVVHEAYDTVRERRVALKVLAPHLVDDERFRARFLREARTVAGLSSPHIVAVHDFGVLDGRLFLDMALIDGRDLAAALAGGPMTPARAVGVVEQVADALDAAHERGLVHRDVKPANVLLVRRRAGQPDFAYLTDFGLARSTAAAADGDGDGLTMDGTVVGTADYMSPEQAKGRPVDARTDVYALGCLLFHCLTGRPPFAQSNPVLVLDAHRSAPVPPLPDGRGRQGLDRVLATAMAKDPAHRYPSAGALAAAARTALSAAGSEPVPVSEAETFVGQRPTSGEGPYPGSAPRGSGPAGSGPGGIGPGGSGPGVTPLPGPAGGWEQGPGQRRRLGTGAVVGLVLGGVALLVVVLGGGAVALVLALGSSGSGGGGDGSSSGTSSGGASSSTSQDPAPTAVPNPALGATSAGDLPAADAELLPSLPSDLTGCVSASRDDFGGQRSSAVLVCSATHLPGGSVTVRAYADEASRDTAFTTYTQLDTNSRDGCPAMNAAGPWAAPDGTEGGTAVCYDVAVDGAEPDGARYAVVAWTVSGRPWFFAGSDPSESDADTVYDWQQAWASDYAPTVSPSSG